MSSRRKRRLELRELKHWYKPTKEGEAAREALMSDHGAMFEDQAGAVGQDADQIDSSSKTGKTRKHDK